MKIGELARRLDVASSKIRFLEAEGLVQPVGRSTGGYREYDEDSVVTLELILQAQSLGFTLQEIKRGLADNHDVRSHEYLITRLSQKLTELDRHLAQVRDLRSRIVAAIDDVKTRAGNGSAALAACPSRRAAPRLKTRGAGKHTATARTPAVRA
ncbi:MerR family transcriptional regulator [Bradyrhizobium prioriisuperbiae]|uniref:MerR family transcriptional regulator n=1 Tax=Bradyrhizobium prioriisuperbiae TaxID=2854389 RepID=UPI0028E61F3C|nr:MerR family transcriptional regulator [Bradyrhizobium prioritasuperba]